MELCCCTQTLLNDIKTMPNKKSVAQTYSLALRSSEETDWKIVNKAIIERWSMLGLDDIKKMAWSRKCFKKGKE